MASYNIRELSDKFHMPLSTLRYYEDIGLLSNVMHDEKKQRIYTEEHIDRLNAIACFKQAGLPLDQMKRFFKDSDDLEENIDDAIAIMVEHEHTLVQEMEDLQNGLLHIKHKVWFYQEIKRAMENHDKWPLWDAYNIK